MQGFLQIDSNQIRYLRKSNKGFDTRKHQIERRKLKKQKTAKGIEMNEKIKIETELSNLKKEKSKMEDEFNKSQTVIQLFLTNCLDEDSQLSENESEKRRFSSQSGHFYKSNKENEKKNTFNK